MTINGLVFTLMEMQARPPPLPSSVALPSAGAEEEIWRVQADVTAELTLVSVGQHEMLWAGNREA